MSVEEIAAMSAGTLAAAVRAKQVSAREALEAHFGRIDQVNSVINAVVTENRDAAFELAAAADERTSAGGKLPPLHGVPMTHKDTNNTKGMRTTQGSRVLADFVPDFDDLIVERLKTAGVVSTGKSNVPEFGAGSHTFNDVFGTTTNPYDPRLSAGGSSGGAAAAIASRIQPLSDGSDMGGSLRIPASFCNVVGFRPSLGLIPMAPARNAFSWLGRTGPMAREVSDIALAMSVLAGSDSRIPHASPVPAARFAEPLQRDLTGVKIGWSADFGLGIPVQAEALRVLEAQLGVFAELGAVVEEATPDLSDADEVFGNVRAFDFALGLGEAVDQHPELVKPEVQWNVQKGRNLSGQDWINTALARTRLQTAINDFFGRFDVFASPAAQLLPFDASWRYPTSIEGVDFGTYLDWMRSACVISAAGVPSLSVPAGFSSSGLPVGLQLAMPHGKDFELLQVAHAFEQATGFAHQAPALA